MSAIKWAQKLKKVLDKEYSLPFKFWELRAFYYLYSYIFIKIEFLKTFSVMYNQIVNTYSILFLHTIEFLITKKTGMLFDY